MNKRWGLLLAISLPLLALWAWRHQVGARREAERDLFFSYVDGPINDYAMGITRIMPVLQRAKASDLAEAKANLQRSLDVTRTLNTQAPKSWIKSRLEFVLPQHEAALLLLKEIPLKKPALASWLAREKEIRDKIVYTLEDVRYESNGIWRITQSRALELNALIYSLKEAQDAAKN